MAIKLPEFFDGLVGRLIGVKNKDNLLFVLNDIVDKNDNKVDTNVEVKPAENNVPTPTPSKPRKVKHFED